MMLILNICIYFTIFHYYNYIQEGKISDDRQSLIVIQNDNKIMDFNEFLNWMTKNAGFNEDFPEEYKLELYADKEKDHYLVELQKKVIFFLKKKINISIIIKEK